MRYKTQKFCSLLYYSSDATSVDVVSYYLVQFLQLTNKKN